MEGEEEDQRQIIRRGRGVICRKAVICVTEVDVVDVTEGPSLINLICVFVEVHFTAGMQRSRRKFVNIRIDCCLVASLLM